MMTTQVFVLAFLSISLFAHAQQIPGYTLVWSDEFNGPTLDRSKWKNEINCWGGGNGEKQCYIDSPSTLFFQNGHMYMKANYIPNGYTGSEQGCTLEHDRHDGCTRKQFVTSSRIRTKGLHFWKYGRFEARMKIPSGRFLWPAFWMLPERSEYGTWAASGEIDIMESKGQDTKTIHHTLHHGGNWPHNKYTGVPFHSSKPLSDDFHTYAVDWRENEMTFFIDGARTHHVNLNQNWWSGRGPNPYTRNGQPWDKEFYLLLNLAVGGNYFGAEDSQFNAARDAPTWTPFVIDYVRVYKPTTSAQPTVPPQVPVSPSNPSGACVLDKDIDYFGNDVASKPGASKDECCGWCRSVPNCHAWTFAYGTCYGKSAPPPAINRKFVPGLWSGTVSGPRAFSESDSTADSSPSPSKKIEMVAITIGCILGMISLVVLVFSLLLIHRAKTGSMNVERA